MKGRTYRYFTGAPLYPFGHGLSYSRFAYAKLVRPEEGGGGRARRGGGRGARTRAPMAADEVVQLYVTDLEASGPVPLRALKGFAAGLAEAGGEARGALHARRAGALARRAGRRSASSSPGRFTIAVGGKQPGLEGTADAATTMVLTADLELTGRGEGRGTVRRVGRLGEGPVRASGDRRPRPPAPRKSVVSSIPGSVSPCARPVASRPCA